MQLICLWAITNEEFNAKMPRCFKNFFVSLYRDLLGQITLLLIYYFVFFLAFFLNTRARFATARHAISRTTDQRNHWYCEYSLGSTCLAGCFSKQISHWGFHVLILQSYNKFFVDVIWRYTGNTMGVDICTQKRCRMFFNLIWFIHSNNKNWVLLFKSL